MTAALTRPSAAPAGIAATPLSAAESSGLDTSVGKALAVLDAFRGDGALLGVSQIAMRANLPKSTTHRLLTVLVDRGYVERADTRYRLGRAIFELGNMVSDCRPRSLRSIAMPYMTNLYEATHATVHLAVLDGFDALYVEKIYGHQSVDLPSRVGGRVPALCTALGKAMLAFAPHDVREEALSRPVPRMTPRTVVYQPILRAALTQVRTTGIAEDCEGASLGSQCVAAPVIDRRGNVLAAMSMSFPTNVRIPPTAVQLLKQSAGLIGDAS
jgi:DNA-binding IclR family transcriptional regulator